MNPPGVRLNPAGAEVVVVATSADLVEVALFDAGGAEDRIGLSRQPGGRHSGFLSGVGSGTRYGFRVHGPWQPEAGLLHDPARLLVDPHARAVAGEFVDHPSLHHTSHGDDTAPWVPRGVMVAPPPRPRPGPAVAWDDTVIYETHVRGLTRSHPDVEPALRGTYLGAASPPVVDHLRRLGVTTVELMPVAHHVSEPFLQHSGRSNYWGYSTLAWWAPHAGYATGDDGRQVTEFAEMVDRFHAAGLEVILDVVFNHTVEGGELGPILSMKGLDNPGWYRLEAGGGYVDWTGTGNTVNTAHPGVRSAILACLRWWAEDLGVDGFRFDLGVTLGRGADGRFDPSELAWLTEDPVVGARKLIAEPWDLGPDGYQLGRLGPRILEWNAAFRDDVRDAWRGVETDVGTRLAGSPDLFEGKRPIDFVTAHDGFTLADLVAYDHKHNEANGEGNADGHGDNRSWNSGTEGPTDNPEIIERRRRRAAGLLASLLLTDGVPMLLGGDELGRSLAGNNNAYSLDSPESWYDWSQTPHADLIADATELRRSGVRFGVEGVEVRLNPSETDIAVELPPGRWVVGLDSSGLDATGEMEGDATVPAWTLRVFVRLPDPV